MSCHRYIIRELISCCCCCLLPPLMFLYCNLAAEILMQVKYVLHIHLSGLTNSSSSLSPSSCCHHRSLETLSLFHLFLALEWNNIWVISHQKCIFKDSSFTSRYIKIMFWKKMKAVPILALHGCETWKTNNKRAWKQGICSRCKECVEEKSCKTNKLRQGTIN